MTSPVFDKVVTEHFHYCFPSKTESKITKLEIRTGSGVKELKVHFESKEEVLKFCKDYGFVADFAWLNFVTFEGATLPKIRELLMPYFNCDDAKARFVSLTQSLMV